jgi:hypothetical protein
MCTTRLRDGLAQAMLDEEHGILPAADPSDTITYLLRRIGFHNVVIARLPSGKTGIGPAALVAKDMLRSFKFVRFGLMVGVGGGVPGVNNGGADTLDWAT